MTAHGWSVHLDTPKTRAIGTADLDPDLVAQRIVAGKAAYRVDTTRPEIASYRDRLRDRMVLGEVLVTHADPKRPLQARKHKTDRTIITRVRDGVTPPISLRYADVPPVRYVSDRADYETRQWIESQVRERVPVILPAADSERRLQWMLDRYVSIRATKTRPLTRWRNNLTAELDAVYAEIAAALDIDNFTRWFLVHRDTGMQIRVCSTERSEAEQFRLLRRRLIERKQTNQLDIIEEPGRVVLSITKRTPTGEDEQDEIDGD